MKHAKQWGEVIFLMRSWSFEESAFRWDFDVGDDE